MVDPKPILSFGIIDATVVVLFIGGLLALGFSAKLRDHSVFQFLTAGRRLTLPVFVATLVSTWYGGILGIGESTAYYGVGTWVLLGVPYYVFALFYAGKLAEKVRDAEQISIPERLQNRFGKGPALVGAGLVFLLAVPAAHVLMLAVLIQSVTGWSLGVSLLVGVGVGTAFLYKGGLLADARVSLLAFVAMYVGFLAMDVYALTQGSLPAALTNAAPDLRHWDGGQGWIYVLSFFLLGAWTLVDPGFHQRVASAESPAVGKSGVIISVLFWMLFDLLSVTAAMVALRAGVPSASGIQLYPMAAELLLPVGLKAVFVCGMLGTIVSAMVGYSLVAGATLGRDTVARLYPQMRDSQVKLFTRIGIAVGSAVAVSLAFVIPSVVNLWYAWSGLVVGALLIPALSAYWGGPLLRMRSWAISTSMLIGAAVSGVLLTWGIRSGNTSIEIEVLGRKVLVGTLMPALCATGLALLIFSPFARKTNSHE